MTDIEVVRDGLYEFCVGGRVMLRLCSSGFEAATGLRLRDGERAKLRLSFERPVIMYREPSGRWGEWGPWRETRGIDPRTGEEVVTGRLRIRYEEREDGR